MYLIDTNVMSELRKRDRADRSVAGWAATMPVTSFYLSVISLFELELGALRIARRDQVAGSALQDWINHAVLREFGERILPVSTEIVLRCAPMHVPDPRSEADALIAATALTHGLTVVTRNVRDFAGTGATVFNPWTGDFVT